MFQQRYASVFEGSDIWKEIQISGGDLYEWNETSTYIHHPPYFQTLTLVVPSVNDIKSARVLAAFASGATDVLVGTQMIAKGHDFARVTLVGVVDADVGLGLPDFRSAERTFQLLTQVAGRAGRAELPGLVILQSHLPEHYALRLACAQDYDGFFAREMEFRRTMGYPPAAALLNIVVRSRDAERGATEVKALATRLINGQPCPDGTTRAGVGWIGVQGLGAVAAAPEAAGVRVWEVRSRGRGPRGGCPPLPEGANVAYAQCHHQ
jgi:hypothetical protein